MNIPEDADMNGMGWDRTKAEKGVPWKLHNEPDTACPQQCVRNYVKGMSIPGASVSEILHIYIYIYIYICVCERFQS